MERYIGMDVHAASCTLAVISQTGKRLKDLPVETNGQALVEAVRMIAGRKHLALEEGLQSAWLYETLSRHVDEIVVAGSRRAGGRRATSAMRMAWPRSCAWGTSARPSSRPRDSSRAFANCHGST